MPGDQYVTQGATEDEITGVLVAIAPAAGLGRVVGMVTDVAGPAPV